MPMDNDVILRDTKKTAYRHWELADRGDSCGCSKPNTYDHYRWVAQYHASKSGAPTEHNHDIKRR